MTDSQHLDPATPPNGAINDEMVVTVAAPVQERDVPILEGFVREAGAVLAARFSYYEILLVDHGTGDGLARKVEELAREIPNLRLLRLSRSYDEEIAFFAALDCSIGDFVVLMDLDHDPPALIPEMISTCASGFDAVIGKTTDKGPRPLVRRIGSVLFYKLLGALTGHAMDPGATNFRAFSRRIVNSLVRIKERNLYMKYLTEYVGYKQTYIYYERIDRSGQPHTPGLLASLNQAVNVLVANSNKPLRGVAFIGVLASGLNLLYGVFVILNRLLQMFDSAQGWASTNMFNAVMYFLLFSMLAVLSEYVLKILEESRRRPLYYVAYESNSSVVDQYKDALNVV